MGTYVDGTPALHLINTLWGIYNQYRQNKSGAGTAELMADTARVTGPEDVDFIRGSIPSYDINQPYDLALTNKHLNDLETQYQAGTEQTALANLMKNYATDYGTYAETRRQEGGVASPGDFMQQYADRYGGMSPETAKKMGDAITFGEKDAAETARKIVVENQKAAGEKGLQDFYSATAGLLMPSNSRAEAIKNRMRGGFAAPGETISDVLAAAADYLPATPQGTAVLNDVMGRVIQHGKETYPPEARKAEKVGRTTAKVDYNLFGERKPVVQSTAPIVNVTTGEKERRSFEKEQRRLQELQGQLARLRSALPTPGQQAGVQGLEAQIETQRAYINNEYPGRLREVVKVGKEKGTGRKVLLYSDGSVEYGK